MMQPQLLDCAQGCKAVQIAQARQHTAEIATEKRAKEMARQMLKEWQEEYQPPVSALPSDERPVNRILHYSPGACSSAELVAALLGTPQQLYQARTLITRFGGLPGIARASVHEITELEGIGPTLAARLKAACEIGRRLMTASPADRPQVKSPADAANLVMLEMSTLEQEHLKLILLDSKNYVIETITLYVGSLNTSLIRVGEVFRDAIKANAAAIIVLHNHPSGDPTPSPEDVRVTELIVKAGDLVDIEVLDHLIIGQQRYISLKERGLGFP